MFFIGILFGVILVLLQLFSSNNEKYVFMQVHEMVERSFCNQIRNNKITKKMQTFLNTL